VTSALDIVENDRRGGLSGIKSHSAMENNRRETNRNLSAQHKGKQLNAVGSAIGVGMSIGGLPGAGIGLALGIAGIL